LDGWFDAPKVIGEYRPDIVAENGDEVVIVEVVKGPVDWPKIAAFRSYEQSSRCRLIVITIPEDE